MGESRALTVERKAEESSESATARVMLEPAVQSAVSVEQLYRNDLGELSLDALADELSKQVAQVFEGDEVRLEEILLMQVQTLDAIFHATTRRACVNIGHNPEIVERYLKLALKAQSQCAFTLGEIHSRKHPQSAFNQTNIAHGPQQINNFSENELLENKDGQWLDGREKETAVGDDPQLETMGSVNGSEESVGKDAVL